MRWLLITVVLLAPLLGCGIHDPQYYIVYSPEKPLTNSQAAGPINRNAPTNSQSHALPKRADEHSSA
jgi:hypothetical protein